MSETDFDSSGEPGPQAKGVYHLETPFRQLHVTHRASSCAKRGGHVQLCSKPMRGTQNLTRDLEKKGSAFILSSEHWTVCTGSVSLQINGSVCSGVRHPT